MKMDNECKQAKLNANKKKVSHYSKKGCNKIIPERPSQNKRLRLLAIFLRSGGNCSCWEKPSYMLAPVTGNCTHADLWILS